MINNIVYAAIGFVAGAITGGAIVSHVVTKDCSKRIDSLEKQNRALVDDLVKIRDNELETREEEIEKIEKEEKRKYDEIVKQYIPTEEDEEYENIDEFMAHMPSGNTKVERVEITDRSEDIKRIDEARWTNELNFRENTTLTYFQEDGTLTDDNKNIIHNPSQVVGIEIMDIIDETENDYLYALDDELNKIYEITVEHDLSYTRDILGAY